MSQCSAGMKGTNEVGEARRPDRAAPKSCAVPASTSTWFPARESAHQPDIDHGRDTASDIDFEIHTKRRDIVDPDVVEAALADRVGRVGQVTVDLCGRVRDCP